jgi:hypothetical protein
MRWCKKLIDRIFYIKTWEFTYLTTGTFLDEWWWLLQPFLILRDFMQEIWLFIHYFFVIAQLRRNAGFGQSCEVKNDKTIVFWHENIKTTQK